MNDIVSSSGWDGARAFQERPCFMILRCFLALYGRSKQHVKGGGGALRTRPLQ
jgi:hypothetical protein